MITEDLSINIYCEVDDFILGLEEEKDIDISEILPPEAKRGFTCKMSPSEIAAICILFQFSGFRNFKNFYKHLEVINKERNFFSKLLSYNRFVEVKNRVAKLMFFILQCLLKSCSGISFIDSTPVAVCKNKRIRRHRVFKSLAKRGKSSMGWFFGFKLHLCINHMGELLSVDVTQGNVDDRVPVEKMGKNLFGKLFGDRGYISKKLSEKLLSKGVQLITNLKSNMKNKLLPLFDKLVLRKRFIVETAIGIMKEEFHLEHSRHRSNKNFCINLLGVLLAYCLRPTKPAIRLTTQQQKALQGL